MRQLNCTLGAIVTILISWHLGSSGSAGKESSYHAGDMALIPGLGRSPGEGIGYSLQYSQASLVVQLVKQCGRPGFNPWVGKIPGEGKSHPLQYFGLENSMDYIVHGVTKSRTRLTFAFTFHTSSGASQVALVVKNLPDNAGDMRHRFDQWVWKISWRRAWQPTPVFLPGESSGQRSLAGYSP